MIIDLDRFLKAQNQVYLNALNEVQSGRKISHWMWYVFPQIAGLGKSDTSKFYAIQNIQEASAYLKHPVLGHNLIEISTQLVHLKDLTATDIFGEPDKWKLHSCMTLFSGVSSNHKIFSDVLNKYFEGKADQQTVDILKTYVISGAIKHKELEFYNCRFIQIKVFLNPCMIKLNRRSFERSSIC